MGSTVPSPLATGGSGVTYEQRVGAMFLSRLLTRNPQPAFPDCPVKEVGFQTGHRGWRTDDILVACSAGDGRRKIAIQVKRKFTLGSNPDCVKVFRGFWEDFNSDRFDPGRDAVALAAPLNTQNLSSLAGLLECARDSTDADDLKNRLETPGFVQKGVGDHYGTIRRILEEAEAVHDVNDESVRRFLRSIHVLFLDLDQPSSQSMVNIMDMLSRSADGAGAADATYAAEDTWNELVNIAAESASRARTRKYYDLPEGMRERHSPNHVQMNILSHHTKTTLDGIRTTIAGRVILPRDGVAAETAKALAESQVVALTGPAGSGKSALAKGIVERERRGMLCLSFRAEEFARAHLDQALPDSVSAMSLEAIIESEDRVLIHLESLERMLESATRVAFGDLVAMVEHHPSVSLLLTCRDDDMGKAEDAFFGRGPLRCRAIRVPPLDKEDMLQVAEAFPALKAILSRPESRKIVGTPYVLDIAARMEWPDSQDIPTGMRAFRKKWWSEIVRGDGKNSSGLAGLRERTLVGLAMRRARQMRPSVAVEDYDPKTLHALRSDGLIIMGDAGLAAPSHDVVEDWAVMRYIDLLAAEREWQASAMAKDLGASPAVRRGFRGWLRERLDDGSEEADRLVLAAYGDGSLPSYFREDVLISVLLSGSVGDFVSRNKGRLLEDDARLLVEMVRLTRVACTKTPDEYDDRPTHQPILPEPEGGAWPALLQAADESHGRLLPRHFDLLLGLLEDWARGTKYSEMPDGAVPAVRVAHRLLKLSWNSLDDDLRKRIFGIIACVPRAESEGFLYLVEQATSKEGWSNLLLKEFRQILTGPDGIPACRDHPEAMANLVMSLRLMPEQGLVDQEPGAHLYSESEFGLRKVAKEDFRHFSAFCGPFWGLLVHHQEAGLRLVLDIVNYAGDRYASRRKEEDRDGRTRLVQYTRQSKDPIRRITIRVPGRGKVRQWADERLWMAYRGTSDVPHLLICALMALERWLLDMCRGSHTVELLLLYILGESNSVMTTGVVASVCTAHPELGGRATLALLESKRCVELDGLRRQKEGHRPMTRYAATNPQEEYFDDELKGSDALPHRRRDLESFARKMRPGVRGKAPTDDGGEGGEPAAASDTGKADASQNSSVPDAENPLAAASKSLYDWGVERWRRDSNGSDTKPWRQALTAARDCAYPYAESDLVHFTRSGPPVVAAVCVRDHWEEMSADERLWCTDALIAEVGRYSDDGDYAIYAMASSSDSDSIAAGSLPKILALDPDDRRILEAVARSLTHASPTVCLNSARGAGEHLNHNLVLQCAGAVAMLSNLLARREKHRPQKGQASVPDMSEDEQSAAELARRALVDRSVDVEKELMDLDFASRSGRDAAMSITHMLGRAPDLSVTKPFVAKVGWAAVHMWIEEYWMLGNLDQVFGSNEMNGLAEVILSLPYAVLDYCRPLLDAVDERPDRAALFIRPLVDYVDGSSAGHPFWDVWQAFADRIVRAPWISDVVSHSSKGAELVQCMVFDIRWLKDSRHWEYLAGHEEQVCKFVCRLPSTPHVMASFAHYLYLSGAGSDPIQLKAVADCLRDGDPAELLGGGDTVDYLAYALQRYVYGMPAMLKTDPALRKDTILILDRLVDAGSPAAYRMRDDFATPNVG